MVRRRTCAVSNQSLRMNMDLILRSLRSKRLEGWQRAGGHPSRRGEDAAPQDEVGGVERILRPCLKKACWRGNAFWSRAAARGSELRWGAASSTSAPN